LPRPPSMNHLRAVALLRSCAVKPIRFVPQLCHSLEEALTLFALRRGEPEETRSRFGAKPRNLVHVAAHLTTVYRANGCALIWLKTEAFARHFR
jgi:hypothetical protein